MFSRFTSDSLPLLTAATRSVQRDDDRWGPSSDADEFHNGETSFELSLRGRTRRSQESRIMFKDVPIKSGDTLINLALRYNCSVSIYILNRILCRFLLGLVYYIVLYVVKTVKYFLYLIFLYIKC